MNERQEHGALHVGLLTLNRRSLVSQNYNEPELFAVELNSAELVSCEVPARKVLADLGIVASSDRSLVPDLASRNRGYLMRESSTIDLDEREDLTVYSRPELEEYIEASCNDDVRAHFLRQIVKYML